ncbi:MAG: AAA family ATPase [Muribaculaceae bacterium]|nr:AAA family ATPase [Muribaculaceae bacterium]
MESISQTTLSFLPFPPNEGQFALIHALSAFVENRGSRDVFILNGYAGTGKTSVLGALVKALQFLRKKTVILAPTGRAAKVAATMAGGKASTIHKRIFRGNSTDPSNTTFFLAENRDADTLFIVDEASLITDSDNFRQSLLQQLVRHVYSAPGCGMILVGDTAQLPPVGMTESFAMNPERLRNIGLNPIRFSLDVPVRQTAGSGILYNATIVRNALLSNLSFNNFSLKLSSFPDIEAISSRDMADYLSDSWSRVGTEETIIITRSNKRANNYNRAIRNIVMYAEEPLQRGDRIVISKNDYYWSKINKLQNFIANGETAEVTWVGKNEKVFGRWFTDVELRLQDIETPVAAKVMLRSLVTEGANIPREEMERFYTLVMAETEGELSHKIKAATESPYFNALQAKYAYCITCHKAQGGQWKHVYIDMGAIPMDAIGQEFYRWLYTSITRATEKVFLINLSIPHC